MSFFYFLISFSYYLTLTILYPKYLEAKALPFKSSPLRFFIITGTALLLFILLSILGNNKVDFFRFLALLMLASLFFVVLLLFISSKTGTSNWFLVLVIPLSVVFVVFFSELNTPYYDGAMAGFGIPTTLICNMSLFFIYPAFIFLINMLKFKKNVKGIILMSTTMVSIVIGVLHSYGRDGFIADHEGGALFFFVGLVLITRAFLYIYPKAFRRKPLVSK